jgi:hypothetical protein
VSRGTVGTSTSSEQETRPTNQEESGVGGDRIARVAAYAALLGLALIVMGVLPWVTTETRTNLTVKVELAGGGLLTLFVACIAMAALAEGASRGRIPSALAHTLLLLAGGAVLAVVACNYGSVTGGREVGGHWVYLSAGLGYYLEGICGAVVVIAAGAMLVDQLLARLPEPGPGPSASGGTGVGE